MVTNILFNIRFSNANPPHRLRRSFRPPLFVGFPEGN
jgi:hypothetical protein